MIIIRNRKDGIKHGIGLLYPWWSTQAICCRYENGREFLLSYKNEDNYKIEKKRN